MKRKAVLFNASDDELAMLKFLAGKPDNEGNMSLTIRKAIRQAYLNDPEVQKNSQSEPARCLNDSTRS